jgi:hypothetical protein
MLRNGGPGSRERGGSGCKALRRRNSKAISRSCNAADGGVAPPRSSDGRISATSSKLVPRAGSPFLAFPLGNGAFGVLVGFSVGSWTRTRVLQAAVADRELLCRDFVDDSSMLGTTGRHATPLPKQAFERVILTTHRWLLLSTCPSPPAPRRPDFGPTNLAGRPLDLARPRRPYFATALVPSAP